MRVHGELHVQSRQFSIGMRVAQSERRTSRMANALRDLGSVQRVERLEISRYALLGQQSNGPAKNNDDIDRYTGVTA